MIVDSQADTGQTGMNAAHMKKLNDRQRTAVEHYVDFPDRTIGDPRLIVSGTGARKTNALVHRVAHLIPSRLNRHRNKKLELQFSKPKVDAAIKAGYEQHCRYCLLSFGCCAFGIAP